MVRPEALLVARDGAGLSGTMHFVAFLGTTTEFAIDTVAGRLEGVIAGDAPAIAKPGESERVQFAPEGVFLIQT